MVMSSWYHGVPSSQVGIILSRGLWERGKYSIWAYLSSIQHENLTPYKFVVKCLFKSMNGENRQLTGWVWKTTGWSSRLHVNLPIINSRGIYRTFSGFRKENRGMSTCHQLDLQTLGSQPYMPRKNSRSLFQMISSRWIQSLLKKIFGLRIVSRRYVG